MKHTKFMLTMILLSLSTWAALAQEAAETEAAASPQGIPLLILLIGLGAVGVVGLVAISKSMQNNDDAS